VHPQSCQSREADIEKDEKVGVPPQPRSDPRAQRSLYRGDLQLPLRIQAAYLGDEDIRDIVFRGEEDD